MQTTPKKWRMLIIEDNADTRQIYKDVFEREGFEVLVAGDGALGLSYAQATLPDVILLDLMLPKLGGWDVLKRLRESKETKHIAVMIFSALGDSTELKKASELGVTAYSMKANTSPKRMLELVRSLLADLKTNSAQETKPATLP